MLTRERLVARKSASGFPRGRVLMSPRIRAFHQEREANPNFIWHSR
jgi:hypothetical protein